MNIRHQILGFISVLTILAFHSCQSAEGNSTGSEYMPDMAHSVAYEANTFGYYYYNRWGSAEDLHAMVQPRLPVTGTIARGFAGGLYPQDGVNSRGIEHTPNGSVPYYYPDTEEGRTAAMAELIKNPYPITAGGLASGKTLYNIQCAICHGEKGDGSGYLVRDDGGKYPVQPAILTSDEFIAATNGRFYHTIMYGRNLMGSYTDKLSYEERWNVIHYIRSLQAASKSLVYSDKENTLNSVDMPFEMVVKETKVVENAEVTPIVETKDVHTDAKHH